MTATLENGDRGLKPNPPAVISVPLKMTAPPSPASQAASPWPPIPPVEGPSPSTSGPGRPSDPELPEASKFAALVPPLPPDPELPTLKPSAPPPPPPPAMSHRRSPEWERKNTAVAPPPPPPTTPKPPPPPPPAASIRMLLIPLGTTHVCSLPVKAKETSTCAKHRFGERVQTTPAKSSQLRFRCTRWFIIRVIYFYLGSQKLPEAPISTSDHKQKTPRHTRQGFPSTSRLPPPAFHLNRAASPLECEQGSGA